MANPNTIAPIEIHGDNQFPLFNQEGRNRTRYYPPPVYSGGVWGYYTPYLWYDGKKGSTSYTAWRSRLNIQMSIPSYVTLHMWGSYTPLRGDGVIYASFRNDSIGTMRGSVRFVLTEDSIYYLGPNGDPWHNHVVRDYLPDTNGTYIQLNPGDSIVVQRNFTIQSGWDYNRCAIITWFQRDTLFADSSKPVYQSGRKKVSDLLVKIDEVRIWNVKPTLVVSPNPCVRGTNFFFNLPVGVAYSISIYNIVGQRVRLFRGIVSSELTKVEWNRADDNGILLNSGIYLYLFECGKLRNRGKIIVQ